eukprot:COSAG01_NODE_10906_length_2054_cov_3.956522_4_plen_202_part_01
MVGFIKPTGKWEAVGVDREDGTRVTELLLLLVSPDGVVSGAVDDGDGVFDGGEGDCVIEGEFDSGSGELVFDQIYADDGVITTWRARYDAGRDCITDGTWSGECDGTFSAARAHIDVAAAGSGPSMASPAGSSKSSLEPPAAQTGRGTGRDLGTDYIKPTGKWEAVGVDQEDGTRVTELLLLLVSPDGVVSGAVDDGDGVFD